MRLIRPASIPLIESARSGSGTVAEADAAAQALREDYERWSRLGCGLLAYVAAVAGLFFVGVAFEMRTGSADAAEHTVALGLGGAGCAVLAVGAIALCRLWVTGRRLTRAVAWWLRLPYRLTGRSRHAPSWYAPSALRYEPRIFMRGLACALLFIVAVCGFAAPLAAGWRDISPLAVVMALIGVVSVLCLAGILGGVMHIASGLAEGDPLWIAARDR